MTISFFGDPHERIFSSFHEKKWQAPCQQEYLPESMRNAR